MTNSTATKQTRYTDRAKTSYATRSSLPICSNCLSFYRHYGESGCSLPFGHCVTPRLKIRKDSDSCDHFEPKYNG